MDQADFPWRPLGLLLVDKGLMTSNELELALAEQRRTGRLLGQILVGKPGLDGHSNGAEQIAVAARDAGMEVVYQGIRLTPAQIATAARDEDVDIVGLSILSGSHLDLVPETVRQLRSLGVDAPVIVGGIIPDADRPQLEREGVARVFTPKDYRLAEIMDEVADLAIAHRRAQESTVSRQP